MPMAMTILGLCFATIVGLGGYLWWSSQPKVLEGALDGEIVGKSVLPSVIIPITDVTVTADKQTGVLDSLAELPYSLKGSVVTEFYSSNSELKLRVVPTSETMLVRVSPSLNDKLKTWLEENQDRVTIERSSDLRESASKFFAEFNPLDTIKLPRSDQGYYRNRFALSALNPGLGYFVEATTATRVCPCVFEDSVGNLHFAVPQGTTSFRIRGRTLDDATMFPGTFTVTCYQPEQVQATEPTEPAPSEQKTEEPPADKSNSANEEPADSSMQSEMGMQ